MPFITFEGIDGSGKTAILHRVASELERLGIPHVVTREPGGTALGAAIRDLVLTRDMEPLSELFLYAADRAEHVRRVIRPALAAWRVVLCDRYVDSTLAYQVYGRGHSLELVRLVNELTTDGVWPDLTIVLDCAVEIALARKGRSVNRFEQSDFLERVRRGYAEIARAEPERVRIVSSEGPEDVTARRVWEIVTPLVDGSL
jgi:dTMP kinase